MSGSHNANSKPSLVGETLLVNHLPTSPRMGFPEGSFPPAPCTSSCNPSMHILFTFFVFFFSWGQGGVRLAELCTP